MSIRVEKLIVAMSLVIFTLISRGENRFVEGARWEMEVVGDDTPYPVPVQRTVWLEGDTVINEKPGLKMWSDEYDGTPRLITAIHVDGEKVWFIPYADDPEWRLLYDFGLNPGDSCTIWRMPADWNQNYKVASFTLTCLSVDYEDEYGDIPVMTLDEVDHLEDGTEYVTGQGKWLCGIGSVSGVTYNCGFDYVGGGSILTKMWVGDTVFYEGEGFNFAGVEDAGAEPIGEEDEIYDLMGRRISTPMPGTVYVRGGKKFVL